MIKEEQQVTKTTKVTSTNDSITTSVSKTKFDFNVFVDRYFWWFFALAIGVLTFLCFFRLDAAPILSSDEGRHGVNAYEMMKEGNYIANTYNGKVDYWNLKPPLSFYFIMLGYRIFGYNAWGLRFFSALAYLTLAIIVAVFLKKKFNSMASLLSVFMFAACYFYFADHFVRNGDPDALFILFVGVCLIALYLSSENSNWLHLSGLMVALAFLTKSYHAVLLLPIIFLYLIFTKGFAKIKWWQYLTVAAVTLSPILIWLVARVSFDGWQFIKEMLVYDVFKRSTNVIEEHSTNFFVYLPFTILYDNMITICGLLLIVTVIIKLVKKQKLTNLEKLALFSMISIYTVYGLARTKIEWYIWPHCVPLIMFGAVKSVGIWQNSQSYELVKRALVVFLVAVVMFLAGFNTYNICSIKSTHELQDLIRQLPVADETTYFYQDAESTELERAELLVFEWHTDHYLNTGGEIEFAKTENAYLIIKVTDFENWDSDAYDIYYQTENYAICQR